MADDTSPLTPDHTKMVPQIVGQSKKAGPAAKKAAPTPEETSQKNPEQSESAGAAAASEPTSKQSTSAPEPEAESSQEIGAEERGGSVASAPVSQFELERESPPEVDEFWHVAARLVSFHVCCPTLTARFGWIWAILDSPRSIPFWLVLMPASISAGVMGGLYMHNCPADEYLATMILSIGVSLSAAYLLKVCYIVFKMFNGDQTWKYMLKTFFYIAAAITLAAFFAESVKFWKMDSTSDPGTPKYCDPRLTTFAFWWNIFMYVGVMTVFFCPA